MLSERGLEACVPKGIAGELSSCRAGQVLAKTLHFILSKRGGRGAVHRFPLAVFGEQTVGTGVEAGDPGT